MFASDACAEEKRINGEMDKWGRRKRNLMKAKKP
jgi:hypothetical protein